MTKLRIAIRSMINRRDSAACLLLAGVLKKLDCDARVCSQRDFGATLKYWKPHVAVSNARGTGKYIRDLAPQTKTVFWDGEGVNVPGYTAGSAFSKDRRLYDSYDAILLWGDWSYRDLRETCEGYDLSKVSIVGNPNLDLAKFLPKRFCLSKHSNSIGVLTRFRLLNFHDGSPCIKLLPNENNLEGLKAQADDFMALIDAIRAVLVNTNKIVELRPHPLERVQTYIDFKERWFGENSHRVKIDDSLSFAEFAARQKLILTPTSTSFLQAYLLNVPVVDSSVLSSTSSYNMDGNLGEEWLDAAARPRTFSELVSIVEKDDLNVRKNNNIEKQLIDYCDYYSEMPATLRAAKEIIKLAKTASIPRAVLPNRLLDVLDAISLRRTLGHDPNHLNFCYGSGYHALPSGIEEMISSIA